MDQANNIEYDLWQVQTSPIPTLGGTLKFSWGGYTKIDGNGIAETDPSTGRTGQGTAAHFGDLAGRIRAEELRRSYLNHALFIVVNCDDGTFVYPAEGRGRSCAEVFQGNPMANVDAPPMGARLWLDMDQLAIQNLPIAEWKKKILLTMQIYGAFIGDTVRRDTSRSRLSLATSTQALIALPKVMMTHGCASAKRTGKLTIRPMVDRVNTSVSCTVTKTRVAILSIGTGSSGPT
jgi:hypothetical protein